MTRRTMIAMLAASLVPAAVSAQTLSRADAVALAVANNPEVRKSHQALLSLHGQGKEALADALPEINVYGSSTRYRDPSLLNSSSFDAFPPELREALRPVPQNLFDGTAQLKQTLWSFKLGAGIR